MPTKARSTEIGPGQAPSRFGAAYRVLEEAIAARAFPGCAFGVWVGGEVVLPATHPPATHIGALGRFTFEPESPLVSAETAYDVASLTKVVATTAAMMLLVQRQQIDVDTLLGDL